MTLSWQSLGHNPSTSLLFDVQEKFEKFYAQDNEFYAQDNECIPLVVLDFPLGRPRTTKDSFKGRHDLSGRARKLPGV